MVEEQAGGHQSDEDENARGPPTTKAPRDRSVGAGGEVGGGVGAGSDIDDLEVGDCAIEGAFVDVDEQEAGVGVAVAKRVRLLPAEVRVGLPGAGRLDDRDLGALDQAVQRWARDAVTRIGEQAAADPQPVAGAAARPVVELDRLVVDPGDRPRSPASR